jgi:hypothetical protein
VGEPDRTRRPIVNPLNWSVQNRPSDRQIQAAVYGFLTAATLVGGIVGAVIVDQARKIRNENRLARKAAQR